MRLALGHNANLRRHIGGTGTACRVHRVCGRRGRLRARFGVRRWPWPWDAPALRHLTARCGLQARQEADRHARALALGETEAAGLAPLLELAYAVGVVFDDEDPELGSAWLGHPAPLALNFRKDDAHVSIRLTRYAIKRFAENHATCQPLPLSHRFPWLPHPPGHPCLPPCEPPHGCFPPGPRRGQAAVRRARGRARCLRGFPVAPGRHGLGPSRPADSEWQPGRGRRLQRGRPGARPARAAAGAERVRGRGPAGGARWPFAGRVGATGGDRGAAPGACPGSGRNGGRVGAGLVPPPDPR